MKRISAEEFRQFRNKTREKNFLLIDVRQEEEYQSGHIPGALLIPLNLLEEKIENLPEKDLVFYCRSGSRSLVAALTAEEFNESRKEIFNLDGGILAWDGRRLEGTPHFAALDPKKETRQLLIDSMNFEKGAFRFYTYILDHFHDLDLLSAVEKARDGEIAHARLLYAHLKKVDSGIDSFDALYEALTGEIMEGGILFDEYIQQMKPNKDTSRLDIIETGILLEYTAFDLYRVMAETVNDPILEEAFYALSQAEKNHMKILAKAV